MKAYKDMTREELFAEKEKLEAMYDKMPKDFIYVLYCKGGGTGILAAKELFDRGHITRALLGGINAYDGNYIESE